MNIESLFRALSDPTRLRICRLIGTMELAVGELAQVLAQSQPRVSRHIGILCDAGLAERRKEGSWVFLRVPGSPSDSVNLVLNLLESAEKDDPAFAKACEEDRRKLSAIRRSRESSAEEYFARHAADWDELRALHSPDGLVEAALIEALNDRPIGQMLDIGTGTGRMAELFADKAERIIALDKSLEMLKVARAKLQHLPSDQIEIIPGDFGNLPLDDGSVDTVLLHQVLHFAQEPDLALAEAARVTRPGGRIAIIDFAAHNHEELRDRHAHARLGFSDGQVNDLLNSAGFVPATPKSLDEGELTVKIWIGERAYASFSRQD